MNQENNFNTNNNIQYDPMTGQPINQQQQNFNAYQQPMQPQQNFNTYQQPKKSNNNKILIVVVILVILAIIGAIIFINAQKNNNSNNTNTGTTGGVNVGADTTYDENGAFLFAINSVTNFTGRGTFVSGTVERGTIKEGDTVQIIGLDREIITATVGYIYISQEIREYAVIDDYASILLENISSDEVEIGQVLAKPNSIVAAKKFDANVYILSSEEGGRETPIFDGYRPQFYFRTVDITGIVSLPANIEKVMPGDNVSFTVTLASNVAMEVGTKFSIREGGRIIANGKVTKIY